MVVHTRDPTWEAKAGGPQSKATLGKNTRPYLKNN
jgi:hypothetical protein